MVTQLETHVHMTLSSPAKPAAEGPRPLTLRGPAGIEL